MKVLFRSRQHWIPKNKHEIALKSVKAAGKRSHINYV